MIGTAVTSNAADGPCRARPPAGAKRNGASAVMTRRVELASIGLPEIDPPIASPSIPVREYERRLEAMWAAADLDWLVVYGDPEHRGNLAYLCGLDPRFEEAVLIVGEHQRSMLVGTEGRDLAAAALSRSTFCGFRHSAARASIGVPG